MYIYRIIIYTHIPMHMCNITHVYTTWPKGFGTSLYINIYIHVHVYTCINTYIHIYINIYIYTYMYAYTYNKYISTYMCIYIHVNLCIYIYMYICICIHMHEIHTHTHTHTQVETWWVEEQLGISNLTGEYSQKSARDSIFYTWMTTALTFENDKQHF